MTIPELVVFDLAGTTVYDDRDVPRVLQMAMKKFNVEISMDDASRVMGIPKPVAIDQLLKERNHHTLSEGFIDEIHRTFMDAMIQFYRTNDQVREMPGTSEVFRALKRQGVKIVVDTGFDRTITNALLERMGWVENQLLDGSVTSEEVVRGRPYADMIIKAMSLCGVRDVARVAKIGDTASDMQEGTAAGCGWVIGVSTGAYTFEQLTREPHTHLVTSLQEVLQILLPE